jgi:hypothetical protein
MELIITWALERLLRSYVGYLKTMPFKQTERIVQRLKDGEL